MEYASINSKLQYPLRETPQAFERLKIGCPIYYTIVGYDMQYTVAW